MIDPDFLKTPTTNGVAARLFNSAPVVAIRQAAAAAPLFLRMDRGVRLGSALGPALGSALGAILLLVSAPAAAQPETGADGGNIRLLALGDSLVAGYGLEPSDGFTVQLEAALRETGWQVTVLDGGVSGDTTAGGRSRLDWVLADEPDAVLVALGANDGLRGLDPAETRRNLDAILARLAEDEELPTVFAGMYAPPNLGRDYEQAFNSLYTDLASAYDVEFFPFFLEDVAMVEALNQDDGIHPNADGVALIVDNVLPYVVEVLETAQEKQAEIGEG